MSNVTISAEQISTLADKLQGYSSVFAPEAKSITESVGYDNLCAVSQLLHRRKVLAVVTAFETTDAIKAHMLSILDGNAERGLRAPEAKDMRSFAKSAQSTTDQYGKPREAYKAEGGCELKLCLGEAVSFGYSQEAYADYSTYLIPVKGDVSKADINVCNRNISRFFKYSNTHTGYAGSGCSYDAHMIVNEKGALVVLTCRASISD